jgi:hypothetical protein
VSTKPGQLQGELTWLGIRSSASYVREPEGNNVAERFIRTLKEQCLYLHDFETLEEASEVIGEFLERYNRGWLNHAGIVGDPILWEGCGHVLVDDDATARTGSVDRG